MKPQQKAGDQIDLLLEAAGWQVEWMKKRVITLYEALKQKHAPTEEPSKCNRCPFRSKCNILQLQKSENKFIKIEGHLIPSKKIISGGLKYGI